LIASRRPDRVALLSAFAPALRDSGRLDEALAAYQEAIELEPSYETNKAAYTSLTATLRRLGRLDEAQHHGEQLRQVHPDDPYVLNALGAVYTALLQRDRDSHFGRKAEECFIRAARNGAESRNPVRYLRDLAAAVREAGRRLEAAGVAGVRERAAADAERLERHIDQLLGNRSRP